MSWDPFQRAVLAELGHVLYRLPAASSSPAPMPVVAQVVEVADRAVTAPAMDADMLARLARAAGVAVEALLLDPEIAARSARLRGDAAAKRALWPRLRALRRGAG